MPTKSAEDFRLELTDYREQDWKRWGPYVSERAWGTVREDYSTDGSAWSYFPFDDAHRRAFRWNEDGLAGICDRRQNLCFAVALWNGRDPILKERLFGLSGPEGNHGEDVKECYYYLDNTPTHSFMRFLYKYPQSEFPYAELREENRRRGKSESEYELVDTGVFDDNKYFDVFVEYAKADCDDIVVKITAVNRSEDPAPLHILPTLWFRNQWSWFDHPPKPSLKRSTSTSSTILAEQRELGSFELRCEGSPRLLFTENETNAASLFGGKNASPYVKDGINRFVTRNESDAVNPAGIGTKAAAHYVFEIAGNSSETVWLRLSNSGTGESPGNDFVSECESVYVRRHLEADEFYRSIVPESLSEDEQLVMRQALAGMLWSKQFYHYSVKDWIDGDPAFPPPPSKRKHGRNSSWKHLYNDDIISMPDKWEYPWYAAWDLAFHAIPLALVDPGFAKRQLILLLREWYMHPNGQIPAYEWAFGDVNPPVHAWAALRVYRIEAKRKGRADRDFLEKIFHKLLLNFTWWVNRKDAEGNNVFEGGFLGLDNIGVFDRSAALPSGGHIEQSDGTSWMAMFCLNMLAIALELAREDKVYEDVASKFFEHFVYISDAMNNVGGEDTELWDERDGFYYDVLHLPNGEDIPLRLRSMVGLIPLFAVETIEFEMLDRLPDFRRRTEWFLKNRPDLTDKIACMQKPGRENRLLLALVNPERLRRVLRVMLSENEFLSDFGIRAMSRAHRNNPYALKLGDTEYRVEYEPAESKSGMFGGNSNWRGPIWMPVNYLLIEALQKFDFYFGDQFKVEFPTGSERKLSLWDVSQELERRLARIFVRDEDDGSRAVFGNCDKFQTDEHFRDYPLFYEYFHGDHGSGLGASHQTGWTGLVAKLLQQIGDYRD
ncbi:MAG: glucosidase [Acidobacteria bacterium]|nr:glucosidase [Acidobacteriota bacterium]